MILIFWILFIYLFLIKKIFFLILIFTALHWWCSNRFLHMYLFLFQTWASHVQRKHIFFTKAVLALHGAACVASTFIGKADQQPVAPPLLLPPSHPPQTLWTNPYPFYFFSVSRNSHCSSCWTSCFITGRWVYNSIWPTWRTLQDCYNQDTR